MAGQQTTCLEGKSIMRVTTWCVAVFLSLLTATFPARADEPKGDVQNGNRLVGTWKQVSAKFGGNDFKPEEGTTTLKHVTPTQFMWVTYDKDGKMTRAAGGRYTLKGKDGYEETPEYGLSSDFDVIKGKLQKFNWKLEGNKWHHVGALSNGLTIDEVWERVERTDAPPSPTTRQAGKTEGKSQPFQYFKVQGKVTYEDGSLIPASRLVLRFIPVTKPDVGKLVPPAGSGEVDVRTGEFASVTSHRFGDGITPGEHKLLILAGGSAVPEEYTKLDTTPLMVNANDSPFEFRIRKPADTK